MPENITATIGNNLDRSCFSDERKSNAFWVHNHSISSLLLTSPDLPLNETEVLELFSERLTDPVHLFSGKAGGRYTCFAVNEAGIDTVSVEVFLLPEIIQHPQNITTQEGGNITISCQGDSYPPPLYAWKRLNLKSNSFEDIGETANTLNFFPVSIEDYGVYQCSIEVPLINMIALSDTAYIIGITAESISMLVIIVFSV